MDDDRIAELARAARVRLAERGIDTSWMGAGAYVVDPDGPEASYWDDWMAGGAPDGDRVTLSDADRAHVLAVPLTVRQAARREGVSERTVYRWLKSGELDAHRAGSGWRITREALDVRRIESKKPKATPPIKKHRPRKRVAQTSDASWWPS